MPRFNPADYVDVAERIQLFWKMHPDGRIFTHMEEHTEGLKRIVFSAAVYRNAEDAYPAATGWAFEDEGGSGANLTSHVENGETSAIGRALANLGLKTRVDEPRPSKQEMEKVERMTPVLSSPPAGTAGTGLARIFRSES